MVNLVFASGSVKGFSYIGCLKALEEAHLMPKVGAYAGTSIGAIMAVILSIGYTADELYDFVLHLSYKEHLKDTNILRFFHTYGMESGDNFTKLFRVMIRRKTGLDNPTFLQLYKTTQKNVIVTGTCCGSSRHKKGIHYFSWERTPDMPVIVALRITMSVPFLFVPVFWDETYWVDGVMLDPFPLHLFDPKDTIGFKFGYHPNGVSKTYVHTFEKFVQNIWACVHDELHHLRHEGTEYKNVITIVADNVNTMDLDIGQESRIALYKCGLDTTRQWLLDNKDFGTTETAVAEAPEATVTAKINEDMTTTTSDELITAQVIRSGNYEDAVQDKSAVDESVV